MFLSATLTLNFSHIYNIALAFILRLDTFIPIHSFHFKFIVQYFLFFLDIPNFEYIIFFLEDSHVSNLPIPKKLFSTAN